MFQLLKTQIEEQLRGEKEYIFKFNASYAFQRHDEVTVPQSGSFTYPGNELLGEYVGANNATLSNEILESILDSMTRCEGGTELLPYFYIDTIQLYNEDGFFKPKPILYVPNSVPNVTVQLTCAQNLSSSSQGQAWWSFTYAGASPNLPQAGGRCYLSYSV